VRCHAHQHWRGAGIYEEAAGQEEGTSNSRYSTVCLVYDCQCLRSTTCAKPSMRLHNRRTTILPSTTNLIGAYGPPLGAGVVSSCAPNITMMCLRRVARSRSACNSPLHCLPTPLGVCFGKDAIIGPRAPPRDDKLQSKKCDTGHMQAFSPCRDASGGVSFTLAGRLPFTRGSIPGVNDNMHASVYVCFGKAAIARP